MASVRYSFTLDAIKDAELVRWLELQVNTSASVRDALRAWVDRPTHQELDAKLDQVLEALRDVRVVGTPAEIQKSTEPARARAGLNALKARFSRR